MIGVRGIGRDPRPIFDSSERRSPVVEELVALVRYRDLILQLVSRSVKTRYKRSVLGVAWTMVNPLLTMLVLTLVFSRVFRFSTNEYALYVLSGLVAWNFFAQTTTAAMGDLVWSGGLIGRVQLPKSVFAFAAVGTGLVNLGLALIAFLGISLALGRPLASSLALVPLPVAALAMFSLGMGLAVSSLAVYFQDVMPTYEVLLTAWMYLTPVIYPVELVPEGIAPILRVNPMFYIVKAFRTVLQGDRLPDLAVFGPALLVGAGMLVIGWWLFTRRAREYAYHV